MQHERDEVLIATIVFAAAVALLALAGNPMSYQFPPATGTCDWGDCGKRARYRRWSRQLLRWLPVCGDHRAERQMDMRAERVPVRERERQREQEIVSRGRRRR